MIDQHFEALGFGPAESKVYMALIQLGVSQPTVIAQLVNLPRTTVQSALQRLSQRGLVNSERRGKKVIFRANNPTALERVVDHERAALDAKSRAAKHILDTIGPLFESASASLPTVQFFEGKQNVTAMLYDHSPIWNKNIMQHDPVVWGYQDEAYFKNYEKYSYHYWKEKEKANFPYEIKLFGTKEEVAVGKKLKIPHREVRVLPQGLDFTSTIWAGGEYIIMINASERPNYAVEIKSALLSANLQKVFRYLWQLTARN